jgi:hypothetical protein
VSTGCSMSRTSRNDDLNGIFDEKALLIERCFLLLGMRSLVLSDVPP